MIYISVRFLLNGIFARIVNEAPTTGPAQQTREDRSSAHGDYCSFIIPLWIGILFIMKKKTKKFILEFLDFWPLTIVVPLMLIGIVLGAALGWGG